MCSKCGREQQLRRGLCHACYERGRRAGSRPRSFGSRPSGAARIEAPSLPATTITEIHRNRTQPLGERNDPPWRYRPLHQRP